MKRPGRSKSTIIIIGFALFLFLSAAKSQCLHSATILTHKQVFLNNKPIDCNPEDAVIKQPSGKYRIYFRATHIDGLQGETEEPLQINFLTPWWRKTFAIFFYVLIGIGLIVLGIFVTLQRQKLKLALHIERLETEKRNALDRNKSRFFADISHEFRTPLSLILGIVDRLKAETNEYESLRNLFLIQRHAGRLLDMINELLDLSKLEFDKMKLQASLGDLPPFVGQLTESFISMAIQKEVSLSFCSDKESVMCFFDPEKMKKIVINLISNSLKFTKPGGNVVVKLTLCRDDSHDFCKTQEGCEILTVSDSGIGIPEEHLPYIFDPYYQVNTPGAPQDSGTGIGLALVKELVEMHGGTIRVQSEKTEGTQFTVTFPLGKQHLRPEQIVDAPPKTWAGEDLFMDVSMKTPIDVNPFHPAKDETEKKTEKLLILVVEDEPPMRTFIREELQHNYRVIESGDGKAGLEAAIENVPDLVISDVVMPKMGGYTLCQNLKSRETTSHIPVILLSARVAPDDRLRGFELGADEYLIKPFDSEELCVRVKNLITQRQLLKKRYSKIQALKPSEIASNSIDQQFLEKTLAIVERNIKNEKFGVPDLMREIGMSRTQLFRKLKALTNQSAHDLIQTIRLQRAAQLLQQKAGGIAEIAYQVGFSDPGYFTKVFRKHFDMLPSEYANGHEQ